MVAFNHYSSKKFAKSNLWAFPLRSWKQSYLLIKAMKLQILKEKFPSTEKTNVRKYVSLFEKQAHRMMMPNCQEQRI